MYMKSVPHISPSQRPPLHHSTSSIGFTIVDALKLTKSRKKNSKADLASIDFDNIDVMMSNTYHLLLMTTFCLFCLLWHLEFQIRMAVQWTAWTEIVRATLGASPKPRIPKIILDYPSGSLLVHVISNILMTIVIIRIAMGVSWTTRNELVQLLFHLLWVMFPILGLLLSVRYVVPHMCALLCVMLE